MRVSERLRGNIVWVIMFHSLFSLFKNLEFKNDQIHNDRSLIIKVRGSRRI